MDSGNLSIGAVAGRTGIAVSAIRFYEDRGLVAPDRNAGGQRRFRRSDIRRLSFIRIAQQLGFSIAQIADAIATLPDHRTPTKRDWDKLARAFRADLDHRISALERLRDRLDGCIGCGCLSLDKCALYNPDDVHASSGSGPRLLIEAD